MEPRRREQNIVTKKRKELRENAANEAWKEFWG